MTEREQIRLRIVQLQQRLLAQRQAWLSCADNRQRLRILREHNHQVLRDCFHTLLQDGSVTAAADFFFEHLYPLHEHDWRDDQLARTVPRMCRVMPVTACAVLEQAIALDCLTFELDLAQAQGEPPSGPRVAALRRQQLETVIALGHGLVTVTRVPLMAWLLKCAGPVARRKGLAELHQFFSTGLAAFLSLSAPESVLLRIQTAGQQGIAVRRDNV